MIPNQLTSVREWYQLLNDRSALMTQPVAHHRELLHQAFALRDSHAIDAATLADLLELADAALDHAQDLSANADERGGVRWKS